MRYAFRTVIVRPSTSGGNLGVLAGFEVGSLIGAVAIDLLPKGEILAQWQKVFRRSSRGACGGWSPGDAHQLPEAVYLRACGGSMAGIATVVEFCPLIVADSGFRVATRQWAARGHRDSAMPMATSLRLRLS